MRMLPHFCVHRWVGIKERDILLASPGSPGNFFFFFFFFPERWGHPELASTYIHPFCFPKKLPTLCFIKASASHHLTWYCLLFTLR